MSYVFLRQNRHFIAFCVVGQSLLALFHWELVSGHWHVWRGWLDIKYIALKHCFDSIHRSAYKHVERKFGNKKWSVNQAIYKGKFQIPKPCKIFSRIVSNDANVQKPMLDEKKWKNFGTHQILTLNGVWLPVIDWLIWFNHYIALIHQERSHQ